MRDEKSTACSGKTRPIFYLNEQINININNILYYAIRQHIQLKGNLKYY